MSNLNPAALADTGKGPAFIQRNTPLAVREYADALEGQESAVIAQSRSAITTRERLNDAITEAAFRLRQAEEKFKESPRATTADREHIESLRAMHESAVAKLAAFEKSETKRKAALSNGRGVMGFEKILKHAVSRWHVPMRDIPGKPLADADATPEALEAIRAKIDAAYAGINAAQSAPLTVVEALNQAKGVVDRDLAKLTNGTSLGAFFTVSYDEEGRPLPSSAKIDVERLAVRACREFILGYAENRLREIGETLAASGKKPLSHAARKTKIAKLRAEIDRLEVLEGQCLRALAAKGVFVAPRHNTVNLNSIFGIEPDAEEIARRKAATANAA